MIHAEIDEAIDAPVAQVWALFRDFGGVQRYTPSLESCTLEGEGIGAVRTLTLPGGAVLRERLEALDDPGTRLQYSILDGPLPVQDYLATVQLRADGETCRVQWSSDFEAPALEEAAAIELIEGVYRGGLEGIRKALGV